jgi:hypothetical protein
MMFGRFCPPPSFDGATAKALASKERREAKVKQNQKQLDFGFLERATGVSPIRRLSEPEAPPVCDGVFLRSDACKPFEQPPNGRDGRAPFFSEAKSNFKER